MSALFSRFDWKKSPAHVDMLSKFLVPRSTKYFMNDYWQQSLKEAPLKAVERFIDKQLIEPADAKSIAESVFTTAKLKGLLRERGLKVSGKRAELIVRLLDADPEWAEKFAIGAHLYQCTEEGRALAEEQQARARSEHRNVEAEVLESLRKGNFEKASKIIGRYQEKRGSDERDISEDVQMLRAMFETTPQILAGVTEETLSILRFAAGMMYLWGAIKAKVWLPPDLDTGLRMNPETAASMIYIHADYCRQIKDWRESGMVDRVEIIGSGDSCEACREIAGKTFSIDEVPTIPCPKCTHKKGCLCVISPKVDL